jgi:hypothetical protein
MKCVHEFRTAKKTKKSNRKVSIIVFPHLRAQKISESARSNDTKHRLERTRGIPTHSSHRIFSIKSFNTSAATTRDTSADACRLVLFAAGSVGSVSLAYMSLLICRPRPRPRVSSSSLVLLLWSGEKSRAPSGVLRGLLMLWNTRTASGDGEPHCCASVSSPSSNAVLDFRGGLGVRGSTKPSAETAGDAMRDGSAKLMGIAGGGSALKVRGAVIPDANGRGLVNGERVAPMPAPELAKLINSRSSKDSLALENFMDESASCEVGWIGSTMSFSRLAIAASTASGFSSTMNVRTPELSKK